MAHRINLSRTPAHLQVPAYQRMVELAPACTPADDTFREPLTEAEAEAVLETLGR